MATEKIVYVGETERGRRVREDSLQECVASLAFVANKDPAQVVTLERPVLGRALWLVYENQAELDRDLERQSGDTMNAWFAAIGTEYGDKK